MFCQNVPDRNAGRRCRIDARTQSQPPPLRSAREVERLGEPSLTQKVTAVAVLHCVLVLLLSLLLFSGAIRVDGKTCRDIIFVDKPVLHKISFNFLTADIRQHDAVDFNAGRERLSGLLFHFPAEGRILNDVLFSVGEIVLVEHGADTLAPAAGGFEIGSDLWFFHKVQVN